MITTNSGRLSVDWSRVPAGAGWGAVATVAMSMLMLAGVASGTAPMPKPIPAALIGQTFGALPEPARMVLAVVSHIGYGAAAGAVLAMLVSRVSVRHAVAYGVLLWMLMGLIWLPYLGWGLFGTGITPAVAVATLVLHLAYGIALGLLLDRRAAATGNRSAES